MVEPSGERVLAVIPAYNEEAAIGRVVSGVRAVAPGAVILVVDDGSADATASRALAAGARVVRHPFNLGIGATVQTGLKYAQAGAYDLVIRVDGDGQHDPAGIGDLWAALRNQGADAVFGSRFLGTRALMRIPPSRRLGIRCFALVVTALTGQRATDVTSGFFCLNRRAIALLAEYMPQDYPEVESRVVLHKAGLKVVEVPVQMLARRSGISSINAWRSLYYAFKVSVAALVTALKDVPVLSQEPSNVNSRHPTDRGPGIQPVPAGGDRPPDP